MAIYKVTMRIKTEGDNVLMTSLMRGWLKGNLESVRVGNAIIDKVTVPSIEREK